MRKTSSEALKEIQSSGLLGKRQKHAYEVLYLKGPLTGNELSREMGIPGQWKRCSELQRRAIVEEVGEKICSVTGYKAILWDVNGRHPEKAVPPKSKLKAENERLEEENRGLKLVITELFQAGAFNAFDPSVKKMAEKMVQTFAKG